MRFFIVLLLSFVCVAKSQVRGPNNNFLDIIFERIEQGKEPKHDSKQSEIMFFFYAPDTPPFNVIGVPIWQLNQLQRQSNGSYSIETLNKYYLYNEETQTYYELKIKLKEEDINLEDYPYWLDYLEERLRNNQSFELTEDEDSKNLKITPIITQ